jgi:hypothetical protein
MVRLVQVPVRSARPDAVRGTSWALAHPLLAASAQARMRMRERAKTPAIDVSPHIGAQPFV